MSEAEIPVAIISKFKLTEEDFAAAAATLGCSIEAIKAVSLVETQGGGFDATGYPKTLFEGHYFSRLTNHIYDADYPTISYPKWTREFYGHTAAAEHERLVLATTLDEDASLRSASWGMFQIMGDNYKLCGFDSVNTFVEAMCEGASHQLEAFTQYVMSRKLNDELQSLDWATFAKAYNGPGQVAIYSERLDTAYDKLIDAKDNLA